MSRLFRLTRLRPKEFLCRYYNKIVITDDGSTIVALHQDQGFPYEHSKPLPVEKTESTGILRMDNFEEVKRVFVKTKPEIARKQLAAVTLTTEHRWYPRARDKKAKKTEMDRTYL